MRGLELVEYIDSNVDQSQIEVADWPERVTSSSN